jgi:hypothetical protein
MSPADAPLDGRTDGKMRHPPLDDAIADQVINRPSERRTTYRARRHVGAPLRGRGPSRRPGTRCGHSALPRLPPTSFAFLKDESADCGVTPELDHEQESEALRSELTTAQRTAEMRFAIDPGFVHHSRVEAVIGQRGMDLINRETQTLPDLPEWMRQVPSTTSIRAYWWRSAKRSACPRSANY